MAEIPDYWSLEFDRLDVSETAAQRITDMIRHQKTLVGIPPWAFKEFRSPMLQLQMVQVYWNLKGHFSKNGTPKMAYFVKRDSYRNLLVSGNQ